MKKQKKQPEENTFQGNTFQIEGPPNVMAEPTITELVHENLERAQKILVRARCLRRTLFNDGDTGEQSLDMVSIESSVAQSSRLLRDAMVDLENILARL